MSRKGSLLLISNSEVNCVSVNLCLELSFKWQCKKLPIHTIMKNRFLLNCCVYVGASVYKCFFVCEFPAYLYPQSISDLLYLRSISLPCSAPKLRVSEEMPNVTGSYYYYFFNNELLPLVTARHLSHTHMIWHFLTADVPVRLWLGARVVEEEEPKGRQVGCVSQHYRASNSIWCWGKRPSCIHPYSLKTTFTCF